MKRRPSFWRSVRHAVGFKVTPVGRVAVLAMFLSAAGAVSVEIPIYQIFCGVVALFGTVEFAGMLLRPKLVARAWFPEKVTAGEMVQGYVQVTNQGRLPACDIMCATFGLPAQLRHVDDHRLIPEIAQGETATIPVTIEALTRGEYVLPEIRVHSTFPFNLMRFGGARISPTKLTVLPAFHRLEEFHLPFSARYQPGGILVDSTLGHSPEYIGNRDYVPGESIRRLDFKAWARAGKPVVREYHDEYCARVAIVLDTYHPGRLRRAIPDLEAAVSLTATIADQLNAIESIIDVFAAGPDLFLFQTSSGTTHFESVLEILAAVDRTRRNPLEKLTPVIADSLDSISTVVCVFLDWDDSREELTRQIVEAGCAIRIILVRSRPTSKPYPADEETFSRHRAVDILNGNVVEL